MVDIKNERNLTMLMDFYEMTMAGGYFLHGMGEKEVVFDMFFRKVPDGGGYAVFAGLEQMVQYITNLHFSPEDIQYLRGRGFREDFLRYLADFRFSCDLWAVEEGTPIFPGEPVVVVKGPAIQAQLIETMVLLSCNFQSLITTKAVRMVQAAQGRPIFEFGSRRAQSYDAAVLGARATYIGGCAGTACVLAELNHGIPAVGTMAHSWVQMFENEYDSFKAYAEAYPDACTLLVDTYNTLRSGVPNAIRCFNEVVLPSGHRPKGIRIDSGDLAYLSKQARVMLDEAGFSDVKIMASNSLDEYIIRELLRQGAQVDIFGVGEKLITAASNPVFGGVYKLVAAEHEGELTPRIKLSDTPEKLTTPGFKNLYRIYDADTGMAEADYITFHDEVVDEGQPLILFDPDAHWRKKKLVHFKAQPLLKQIFRRGELVYELPTLEAIRKNLEEQSSRIWDEVKRFENPHRYYVDLSERLWNEKMALLNRMGQPQ